MVKENGREQAVLFAELLGAAELYARAGDKAAHAAIANSTGRLVHAVESCGARVVKTIGSRLMVLAPDADTAARAAVAMHDAAADFRAVGAAGLTLGVGVHFGPVIQEGGDVFGDAVNLAARLVEQAASGEILLAEETAAELSAPYRTLARSLYSIPVKGRTEEVALYELTWRGDQSATFMPSSPPKPRRAKLTLLYRGAQLVMQHGPEALTIGREEGCGLVLASEHASRHHCTIQRRHDHFVLTDKSTNGTFVTVEGEGEQRLQHDQLTLRRRGWISFGIPRNGENEAAEFRCD